jgi:hypothetical protein
MSCSRPPRLRVGEERIRGPARIDAAVPIPQGSSLQRNTARSVVDEPNWKDMLTDSAEQGQRVAYCSFSDCVIPGVLQFLDAAGLAQRIVK